MCHVRYGSKRLTHICAGIRDTREYIMHTYMHAYMYVYFLWTCSVCKCVYFMVCFITRSLCGMWDNKTIRLSRRNTARAQKPTNSGTHSIMFCLPVRRRSTFDSPACCTDYDWHDAQLHLTPSLNIPPLEYTFFPHLVLVFIALLYFSCVWLFVSASAYLLHSQPVRRPSNSPRFILNAYTCYAVRWTLASHDGCW